MEPVLRLHAFAGNAGPHELGEAVDVHRVQRETGFDLRAHGLGPGLGPENTDAKRRFGGIQALALEFVGDRQHVGGRNHDDAGREVVDQADLPRRHAAGGRYHRTAQPLRAVMGAEAAGKEAVAIGHMGDVPRTAAGGPDGTGHQIGPDLDVPPRISHHRGPPGGPARSMDTHEFPPGDGEKPEGIARPQVFLLSEWQPGDIRGQIQIFRVEAQGIEPGAVMRHVLVGTANRMAEAVRLKRRERVAARGLDGIERRPIRNRAHETGSIAARRRLNGPGSGVRASP